MYTNKVETRLIETTADGEFYEMTELNVYQQKKARILQLTAILQHILGNSELYFLLHRASLT